MKFLLLLTSLMLLPASLHAGDLDRRLQALHSHRAAAIQQHRDHFHDFQLRLANTLAVHETLRVFRALEQHEATQRAREFHNPFYFDPREAILLDQNPSRVFHRYHSLHR